MTDDRPGDCSGDRFGHQQANKNTEAAAASQRPPQSQHLKMQKGARGSTTSSTTVRGLVYFHSFHVSTLCPCLAGVLPEWRRGRDAGSPRAPGTWPGRQGQPSRRPAWPADPVTRAYSISMCGEKQARVINCTTNDYYTRYVVSFRYLVSFAHVDKVCRCSQN